MQKLALEYIHIYRIAGKFDCLAIGVETTKLPILLSATMRNDVIALLAPPGTPLRELCI